MPLSEKHVISNKSINNQTDDECDISTVLRLFFKPRAHGTFYKCASFFEKVCIPYIIYLVGWNSSSY
jgi:3-phenylpropionate/cinnamic acid dioxygenase small subunit